MASLQIDTSLEPHFSISKTKANSKKWSKEEDLRLVQMVDEHGSKDWILVATFMPDRSGKQCRERYHNHLQPNIRKGSWTEEEDRMIVKLQAEIGNQWAKMALYLPGRTDNTIKNRWHAINRYDDISQIRRKPIKPTVSSIVSSPSTNVSCTKHRLVPTLSISSISSTPSTKAMQLSDSNSAINPISDSDLANFASEVLLSCRSEMSEGPTSARSAFFFSQEFSEAVNDYDDEEMTDDEWNDQDLSFEMDEEEEVDLDRSLSLNLDDSDTDASLFGENHSEPCLSWREESIGNDNLVSIQPFGGADISMDSIMKMESLTISPPGIPSSRVAEILSSTSTKPRRRNSENPMTITSAARYAMTNPEHTTPRSPRTDKEKRRRSI